MRSVPTCTKGCTSSPATWGCPAYILPSAPSTRTWTTRADLEWFAQAFWAQSIDLKCRFGWQPPSAADFPHRVYEVLSLALDYPPDELQSLMGLLIREWKRQAGEVMGRFGHEVTW
jgi:hypothetical protein